MKRVRRAITLGLVFAPATAQAAETVCVEVATRTWIVEAPPPARQPAPPVQPAQAVRPGQPVPAARPAQPVQPQQEGGVAAQIHGYAAPLVLPQPAPIVVEAPVLVTAPADPVIDPVLYLRRLLEYEVTHHPAYEAALGDVCDHQLTVELYALEEGWTVFGRFSGYTREEKIEHAKLDEFWAVADRLAGALLADVSIEETLNRENVLRADSEGDLRTVDGQSYFVVGLGTMLRSGELPTAVGATQPVEDQRRLLTPPALLLGYRGKYKAWGIGAHARFGFGAGNKALLRNELGGHVDLRESLAFGLQFLRYLDPAGVASLYAGMGASFDLFRFEVIEPSTGTGDRRDREAVWDGGLDLEFILGHEFMRSGDVQFYVQVEASLPSYLLDAETDDAVIDAWMPGGFAQIGMIF